VVDKTFQVSPVGYVRRDGAKTYLEILEPFVPALKQMEHFSHVHVFWWFSAQQDKDSRATLQVQAPYEHPSLGYSRCARPHAQTRLG
jgi:tRNA (Thr-GGU) A37 N-methylase